MARNFHMSREEANKIVKQIRSTHTPLVAIVPTNNKVNAFRLLTDAETNSNTPQKPTLYRKPVGRVLAESGVEVRLTYSNVKEVFEGLPSQAWQKVEDEIYKGTNECLKMVKILGYVPSRKEQQHIEDIQKEVEKAIQEKQTQSTKVSKVSREQLGLTEAEWKLYSTSGRSKFITDKGIERNNEKDVFQLTKERLLINEHDVRDPIVLYGVRYFAGVLDQLSRTRVNYTEVLFAGYKGLAKGVGRIANKTVLYYIEDALSSVNWDRERFVREVNEAQGFKEKLKAYDTIKSIKTVIENNVPYFLVTGDLSKMTYNTYEGRYMYENPMTKARGVTSVGNGEGVEQTYRVTYKAFLDIMNHDDFKDDLITYEEGEWDKLYVTSTKASLKLTPSLVREIDNTMEVDVVTYNANREGTNFLGSALPIWVVSVFESGKIYDNADSVYEDIQELYTKLEKNSYTAKAIENWMTGYDIRNGNTEKLDEYKSLAEQIKNISIQLEPRVIESVNAKFNKNYGSIAEIKDQDFGLDSGFETVAYADNERQATARALQDKFKNELIEPDRAVTFIPRIQSLTIKNFIGRKFIPEINKLLPYSERLNYTSRLD